MAIEESSVVAAQIRKILVHKRWIKATVINTEKIGQVHFMYTGDPSKFFL
jgi:hydroxymethylglutaryl-CoA reductase